MFKNHGKNLHLNSDKNSNNNNHHQNNKSYGKINKKKHTNKRDNSFRVSMKSRIKVNGNKISTSSEQPVSTAQNTQRNVQLKTKKVSFKVFDVVNENIDVLLISETKIDSSFPTAQFYTCNTAPYR